MTKTILSFVIATVVVLSTAPAFALKLQKRIVQEQGIDLPVYIYMPDKIEGKIPAMLLIHGSGGLNLKAKAIYPETFAKVGIATIFIDTFRPRGIDNTIKNQSVVDPIDMAKDALNALNYIKENIPEIDADRVGVMGFSKGGGTVLLLSYRVFEPYPNKPHFARYIAMYPPCNGIRLDRRIRGPMIMLVGEKDNQNTARQCEFLAGLMKKDGTTNLSIHLIPGAHHAWDVPGPAFYEERGENYQNCLFKEVSPQVWIEAHSGIVIYNHGRTPKRPKAIAACVTHKVADGYSAKATSVSMGYILDEVKKLKRK